MDEQMLGAEDFPSPQDFDSEIAEAVEELSAKYKLGDHVRVRYWGFAKNPESEMISACITLHPTEMVDDTVASGGESTLVFAKTDRVTVPTTTAAHELPALNILCWIQAYSVHEAPQSELDKKIISVATSVVCAAFKQNKDLEWFRSIQSLFSKSPNAEKVINGEAEIEDTANEMPSHGSPTGSARPVAEGCEVCDSEIHMTSDLSFGRCTKGHLFIRCGISFLAIQEPGISKSCARCGKQFLDPLKLEAPTGPSLIRALFEEFDVCPYCQGKFRG